MIKIHCIIAKKENVQSHIRQDANKLYNYMCGLIVPQYVTKEPFFEFIPDKRSIKVESGNSLSDYLQTKIWFDHSSTAKLLNKPQESHQDYNLQFADWIANLVWSNFEDNKTEYFNALSQSSQFKVNKLYFKP